MGAEKSRTHMEWYYSKNSQQQGPVSLDELKGKLAAGEVSKTDLVWHDGMADWTPAGQVADLAATSYPQNEGVYSKDSAASYPSAPPVPASTSAVGTVPNYLWQSIVVTIFCCLPFGIAAIVYAAKVDGLLASGNIQAAQAASKYAKKWMLIALIVGLVVNIVLSFIYFAAMASAFGGMQAQ